MPLTPDQERKQLDREALAAKEFYAAVRGFNVALANAQDAKLTVHVGINLAVGDEGPRLIEGIIKNGLNTRVQKTFAAS